jgi:hypothetical protein
LPRPEFKQRSYYNIAFGGHTMDKNVIDVSGFVNCFSRVIKSRQFELVKRWDNPANYTRYFLGMRYGNSLLEKVCNEMQSLRGLGSLKPFREFLTLDMIFYLRGKKKLKSLADYAIVAIEHENDFKTSLQEMNKLCYLNCPLSVLITYPDRNERKLLGAFGEICRCTDVHGSFATQQKKLLIFGYLYSKGVRQEVPSWSYYAFDGNQFTRFQEANK